MTARHDRSARGAPAVSRAVTGLAVVVGCGAVYLLAPGAGVLGLVVCVVGLVVLRERRLARGRCYTVRCRDCGAAFRTRMRPTGSKWTSLCPSCLRWEL